MHSQQSQHNKGMSHADAANFLYVVLSVVSTCVTPLIRNGFGTESPGMNGLIALVLMIIVCPSVPDMNGYFYLWLFALVMQRANTLHRAHRGEITHSRYDGWPWLALKLPFIRRESTAKLIGEPLICLGLGGLMYLDSPVFGQCFMACGGALFLKCLVERAIVQKRLRRMRDAEIEQRWYAEQFHKGGR